MSSSIRFANQAPREVRADGRIAQRALFELTRGETLCVTGPVPEKAAPPLLVAAIESLEAPTLAWLREVAATPPRLVITPSRARAMGLPTEWVSRIASGVLANGRQQCDGTPGALSLTLPAGATAGEILRLAAASGKHLPGRGELRPASPHEAAALTLARLGQLLPALVSSEIAPGREHHIRQRGIVEIRTGEIERVAGAGALGVRRITEAPVPLEEAENAHFVLFREAGGLYEHVAILVGLPESWPDPVPVRLHSACLTGDLYGSLRCDCGEQLRGSLRAFVAKGGGVLLYLTQEGRGIGLANKLRAYTLQEEGLDTIEADCTLGFGPDERTYEAAISMLREFGIRRVELLTNNPEKVAAVEAGGIEVIRREPLYGTVNRHNLPYVRAKAHQAGHWLEEMLAGYVGPEGSG